GLPGGKEPPESGPVRLVEPFRHEGGQRPAGRVLVGIPEHALGAAVEVDDPALFVRGDDGVARRVGDGKELLAAFPQLLGHRAGGDADAPIVVPGVRAAGSAWPGGEVPGDTREDGRSPPEADQVRFTNRRNSSAGTGRLKKNPWPSSHRSRSRN